MTATLTRTPTSTAGSRLSRLRRVRRLRPGPLTYLTLTAFVFFSAFPLYWSVVVASRDNSVLGRVPPPLFPGDQLIANLRRVFDTVPFGLAMVNSLIVSSVITFSVVLFSTLAGFAFAKLRFRGRPGLYVAVIATMMVPTQLGIIPLYMLMAKLELIDSLYAVIAPNLVSAFGVFFMTQYLTAALPTELLEAGRVDGATTIRLFWHVVLPVARPAAAVLGMLTFMNAWNDFFWPLVVLTPENPTVQVLLSSIASGYFTDYSLTLTGTALATLPLILVLAVLGKQLIRGIMQGAVKG
ncbi:carbohydrate ABC transporter permease [Planotetraspora sp. A-T 1434]|uniref:carbohydrate ABC transporter permease n=1 Tax=Planotetraspora sp. A-T 1434 TaxID=2979219 RepID=UPI0021C1241E|nr:carbohydrate ABC transporter permease [Planotetraspora sp. A-T 1434]MCT9930817.1 carbohydrate ABC transporter permease [Planotetraspora sp. A-T 1434]